MLDLVHSNTASKIVPIPWAKPDFWGNEREYVNEALSSTWISGGPFVERLETLVASHCHTRFAISASNGTTALHMAYLAVGISPDDEVIVPGFAFQAAANVALHMGARPVFAEVDPQTWCLTADGIARCLTKRTKLIVPIHTYGNVCPMDQILEVGRANRVIVLEDAAEAFGSLYKGRLAGTWGELGSFSFQATKTITTGEGGMVVTDDSRLSDLMMLYRSHGMLRKRYWHEVPGHNFRLTNLQAALGCAQFEGLPEITKQRKRIHNCYANCLADVPGLTMQFFPPEVEPLLWAIAVKLDPAAFPQGRDAVIQQLQAESIETRPGFYAASLMNLYDCPPLPVCEDVSKQVISLPTFASLANDQIAFICQNIKSLRR
jgi:perosamine synthetase